MAKLADLSACFVGTFSLGHEIDDPTSYVLLLLSSVRMCVSEYMIVKKKGISFVCLCKCFI